MTSDEQKAHAMAYLRRVDRRQQREFTEDHLAAFGKAIETGLRMGAEIDQAFKVRDLLMKILALKRSPHEGDWNLEKDPVVGMVAEAAENCREFLAAADRFVKPPREIVIALEKLDTFLKANRVFERNRASFTPRQVAGLFVARLELQLGRKLQPKEFHGLLQIQDEFGEDLPTVEACREILVKSRRSQRGVTTKSGRSKRKSLLAELDAAASAKSLFAGIAAALPEEVPIAELGAAAPKKSS